VSRHVSRSVLMVAAEGTGRRLHHRGASNVHSYESDRLEWRTTTGEVAVVLLDQRKR
jgi:hypothetical protein